MYTIVKIQDAVQGYLSITVLEGNENRQYTIRTVIYTELGSPSRGDEITDEQLSAMRDADEYYRAKRAALSILSYGDNNTRTLITKLRARSISESIAEEVVGEMISLGYIDERRQLERLIVEYTNRKLLGPKKTVPRLLSKGYAISDIKDTYESLSCAGEIDIEKNKELLIEKYLGGDRDAEATRRLLFKYGYDF